GTQAKQVALQTSQLELQRQQKQMTLLSQAVDNGKIGSGQTTADQMDLMAQIALDSDKPEEARQYSQTASTIRTGQAYIATQQAEQQRKSLTDMADFLDGIHDEASWHTALQNFVMTHPDEAKDPHVSAILHAPYSEQLIQELHNGVQTSLQKAETAAAQAREKATQAGLKLTDARTVQAETAARLNSAREEHLRKAGGVNLTPKAADVQMITDQMAVQYGDPADLAQTSRFRSLAQPVAERALEILRSNPGIPRDQAFRQAFSEAKEDGQFGGLRQVAPRGGSAASKPLALPMKGGKVDIGSMKDNLWYNVQGKPMLLMNGRLYNPGELAKLRSAGSGGGDSGSDDDIGPDPAEPGSDNPADDEPAVDQ